MNTLTSACFRFSAALLLALGMVGPVGLAENRNPPLPPLAAPAERPDDELPGLFLTWQRDPTTTMTLQWLAESDDTPEPAPLHYWQKDLSGRNALTVSTEVITIAGWPGMHLQRVELTGLQPDTDYRFRSGDNGREYGFRTMPTDLRRPLRIAVGGDTRNHDPDWFKNMNRIAMRYRPDFFVWGGDIAYVNARPDRAYRWEGFFHAIHDTLIDENGRVIPAILAIGNHEVLAGYAYGHLGYKETDEWRMRLAPFFYQLFAFPGQPGYNVLDFLDYLSLVVLDSDHSNPTDGKQVPWLDRVLAERRDVPHVFPIYHIPGFPGIGLRDLRDWDPYNELEAARIRNHWVPLFEKHRVEVVFENHGHVYKRTLPVRAEQPHANGVIYLGDGAWGVPTNPARDPDTVWYLEKTANKRHAIIATLHGTHRHFFTVDEDGNIIDEFPATGWITPLK